MKIIVGLGNPGEKYAYTRHNIGFLLLDFMAKENSWEFRFKNELKAWVAEGPWQGEKLLLIKPTTYMNLSGEAVSKVLHFYKQSASDLVAAYDDLDLPLGKIRIRPKGSAGSHNGMKSILDHLKTEQFPRLRLGIGPQPPMIQRADFVLGKFGPQESAEVQKMIELGWEALQFLLSEKDMEKVMGRFNG